MARYDIRTPRLYTDAALGVGMNIVPEQPQAHYLLHVLRLTAGQPVLLFNGRDGEWRGRLEKSGNGIRPQRRGKKSISAPAKRASVRKAKAKNVKGRTR